MRRGSAPIFASSFLLLGILAATGCGGGGTNAKPDPSITVALGSQTVVLPQDGIQASLKVTVTGASGAATITLVGLPAGVSQNFAPDAGGPSGTLTFTGSTAAAPGTYSLTMNVAVGSSTATQAFKLVSAPVAHIASNGDTTRGIKGKLSQFMATSFQIFQYTGDIFGSGATATTRQAELTNLGAQHNRLQVIMDGMPMKANAGLATDWDFTLLDKTVQPVLAAGDHSPELQIGTAPAWMCDSSGRLIVATHANDFAQYAANLVRYYNKGGFDVAGKHFQSPSSYPITWWGIFNEYNLNGMSAADYLTLYNTTVPAMLAVDPSLRISALELSDFGLGSGGTGDPMKALPTFLSTASSSGVNAQVDVLSTHFYGTCNQLDSDATVFAQPAEFAKNVQYFYRALQARPDLLNTQVWVTENNVNADFNDGTGKSTCNPGHPFVTDKRGTSAFFAAWRPYVFSQLGKVGNRALYQWDYSSDPQYGEVDANSTQYLSYWVDRTLANFFPSTPASPSMDILTTTSTDAADIEVLATRAANGEVHVMVVNHALHAASDNDGPGDPRTVVVDTSTFGTFHAASLQVVDGNTSLTNGPTGVGVSPAGRLEISLSGYGTAFLTLVP